MENLRPGGLGNSRAISRLSSASIFFFERGVLKRAGEDPLILGWQIFERLGEISHRRAWRLSVWRCDFGGLRQVPIRMLEWACELEPLIRYYH